MLETIITAFHYLRTVKYFLGLCTNSITITLLLAIMAFFCHSISLRTF